jgi:ATP-dependent phosphofructokinase / diphosphate-dependent phosphofructokinase
MSGKALRIAINCGGGYVPGLNAVVAGATLAAQKLGWNVVGIHDGYDGLLFPDTFPDGGLVHFDARLIDALDVGGTVLGIGAQRPLPGAPYRRERLHRGSRPLG